MNEPNESGKVENVLSLPVPPGHLHWKHASKNSISRFNINQNHQLFNLYSARFDQRKGFLFLRYKKLGLVKRHYLMMKI